MSNSLMPLRRLPSRIALRKAVPDGLVLSSRPGLVATVWSCMEKVEIRPPHRAVLLLQLLERVRRMQLVQHVPVDIDEIAAVGAPRHQMRVPDLVEQRRGHEGDPSGRSQ